MCESLYLCVIQVIFSCISTTMASKESDVLRNEKYMSDAFNSSMANYARAVNEKGNHIWAVKQDNLKNISIGTDMDIQTIDKMIDSKRYVKIGQSEVSTQEDINMLQNTKHNIINKLVTQRKKYFVPDILADENSKIIEDKSAIVKKHSVESIDHKWENIDQCLIYSNVKHGNNSLDISGVKINSFQKFNGHEEIDYKVVNPKTNKKERKKSIDFKATKLKNFQETDKCQNAIGVNKEFQNWCLKRKINYRNSPQKSKFDTSKVKDLEHYSANERRHKVLVSQQEQFKETSTLGQTVLSISIIGEKSHEIVTEYQDLWQLKKNFPKFSEVIPDVDSSAIEFNYSAVALKTLLGYLLNPSYNFDTTRNEITAIEVLSLMYSWEIFKFQDIFLKHVLKNILKESNACRICSLSEHFGLHEITDVCKKLVKNIKYVKFKQKKCFVAISTYMDPSEFCIPLYPIVENLNESFNKAISNEILIESVSGHYIITGIQIQLNVGAKRDNLSKLKIYYSAENITDDIEIPEQSAQKRLNSKIFIYFNKSLVLKPNDKGKISIYTEIKPCLCYTFQEDFYTEKVPNGKFSLTLTSNYRVKNDGVFFIGKLFYHSKSNVV